MQCSNLSIYFHSIRKGLSIAVAVFLADIGVSAALVPIGFSLLGIVGDLLLIEAAFLAILGGFIEFSRSKAVYELRHVTFHTKERFSTAGHVEASKRAIVLFSAALTLFCILIVLVLFE